MVEREYIVTWREEITFEFMVFASNPSEASLRALGIPSYHGAALTSGPKDVKVEAVNG